MNVSVKIDLDVREAEVMRRWAARMRGTMSSAPGYEPSTLVRLGLRIVDTMDRATAEQDREGEALRELPIG